MNEPIQHPGQHGEMTALPTVTQLSDGSWVYTRQPAVRDEQPVMPQVIHQHIHQAPPDRTVQRLALGSGVGAGAVGASVYFGPLLIAAITSMAISLAVLALAVVVTSCAIVMVVRAVSGTGTKRGRGRRK